MRIIYLHYFHLNLGQNATNSHENIMVTMQDILTAQNKALISLNKIHLLIFILAIYSSFDLRVKCVNLMTCFVRFRFLAVLTANQQTVLGSHDLCNVTTNEGRVCEGFMWRALTCAVNLLLIYVF